MHELISLRSLKWKKQDKDFITNICKWQRGTLINGRGGPRPPHQAANQQPPLFVYKQSIVLPAAFKWSRSPAMSRAEDRSTIQKKRPHAPPHPAQKHAEDGSHRPQRVGPQEPVRPGGPRPAAPGPGAAAAGDGGAGQPPLELQLPGGDAAVRQVPVGGSPRGLRRGAGRRRAAGRPGGRLRDRPGEPRRGGVQRAQASRRRDAPPAEEEDALQAGGRARSPLPHHR